MKLTRREFLKALGIVGAGAALGAVAGTGAIDEATSCIGEWTPDMLPAHEPLAKLPGLDSMIMLRKKPSGTVLWNPYTANITTMDASIPVFSDVALEVNTGYVNTESDSVHDLGLRVGGSVPASLTLERDDQLFLYSLGDIYLRGITAGYGETVYHYHFGGYEVEDGYA